MNDEQTGQPQDVQASLTSDSGNGSHPRSYATEKPARELKRSSPPKSPKVERIDSSTIHKSTGPRTAQGKRRSKLNALKHGLFAKAVLLQDDSRAEYDALLNGLLDDFQPQGKLETVLVESLATVLWRKRRLLQAETSEIENAQFENFNLLLQNKAGELEYAQLRGSSDVKLGQSNLRDLLRNAIEILDMHRLLFVADDSEAIESMRRTLKMMYGCETEGPQPYSWRQMPLILSKLLSRAEAKWHDSKDRPDKKEMILGAIGEEIIRLAKLYEAAAEIEAMREAHNLAGAHIPTHDASERLIRYEAHLSREIDRILNRLERLQRIRKGHPLPPQLDVNIT